jgi:hypothetical protein
LRRTSIARKCQSARVTSARSRPRTLRRCAFSRRRRASRVAKRVLSTSIYPSSSRQRMAVWVPSIYPSSSRQRMAVWVSGNGWLSGFPQSPPSCFASSQASAQHLDLSVIEPATDGYLGSRQQMAVWVPRSIPRRLIGRSAEGFPVATAGRCTQGICHVLHELFGAQHDRPGSKSTSLSTRAGIQKIEVEVGALAIRYEFSVALVLFLPPMPRGEDNNSPVGAPGATWSTGIPHAARLELRRQSVYRHPGGL